MWYHFEFISGANPYIAFTKENAEENIRLWKSKGYQVVKIKEGYYKVYDNEEKEGSDFL